MYIIDFVNYINRRYLSVPSGIATATAIIVTCESFYFTAAKLKYLPPFFFVFYLLRTEVMGEVDESTKESLQLVRTGAWIRSVVDVPPIYPHPTAWACLQ